jgi:outer membrane immunogenic protein
MKRTWLTTTAVIAVLASPVAAFAADLSVKAPPMMPYAYTYNWTGFYIGGNLGGAWASGSLTDNFTGASFSGSHSGVIGGGQIGYNWQVSPRFVLGVEWMFDGTSIGGSSNTVTVVGPGGPVTLQGSAGTDWITTLAARFGYASNNWLFYGKAGGGWVKNTATLTDLTNGVSLSGSNTNSGWLVGVGLEYGVTPNWTVKLEYDHLGLNSWTRARPDALIPGDTVTLSREINMFTGGLNYKF